MADTLVVNHGFADGRATPRESVLQKGSAVLVDDLGVPRTRCACGNPLTRPPTEITGSSRSGRPGRGTTRTRSPLSSRCPQRSPSCVSIDLQTGADFDRPVGTKGDRDVPVVEATPTPEPTAVAEPTPVPTPTPAPAEPTPRPDARARARPSPSPHHRDPGNRRCAGDLAVEHRHRPGSARHRPIGKRDLLRCSNVGHRGTARCGRHSRTGRHRPPCREHLLARWRRPSR